MDNLPYPTVSHIQGVTAFADEATAKAALATLHWLDAGAPHENEEIECNLIFTMRTFLYNTTNSSNFDVCGTACCMAGAIEMFRNTAQIKSALEYGGSMGRFELQSAFQIDADDVEDPLVNLFFPRDGQFGLVQDKTPSQAAYTLRKYLFTGEVEWKN